MYSSTHPEERRRPLRELRAEHFRRNNAKRLFEQRTPLSVEKRLERKPLPSFGASETKQRTRRIKEIAAKYYGIKSKPGKFVAKALPVFGVP